MNILLHDEPFTKEVLLREIDKGIADFEQGNIVLHEDAMREIRERIASYDV